MLAKKEKNEKTEFKRCPYCGNEINLMAKKCQYCWEWLVSKQSNSFIDLVTWTNLNRVWRAKYLVRNIIFTLVIYLCAFLVWWIMVAFDGFNVKSLIYALWIVIILILFWFSLYWNIILNNKRLHDWWWSWWLQLLFLLPFVSIILAICMWVVPWNNFENKYGKSCESKMWEKVLAIIFVLMIPLLAIIWILGYNSTYLSSNQFWRAEQEVLQVSPDGVVYWGAYSKKYHVDKDCPAFSNNDTVYEGTVKDAFERWLTEPCRRCIPEYKWDEDEYEWEKAWIWNLVENLVEELSTD